MSKTFSQNDVSSHSKPNDLWIVVDHDVYDLTKFQDDHPGKQLRLVIGETLPTVRMFSAVFPESSAMLITESRWQEDPPASRRQGRLEAVLEVP